MNRLILSLTILLVCCSTAWPQNRADSPEVMKQLLAAPAPTPRTSEPASPEQPRPEKFFDTNNVPPDDAPTDDLIAYWTQLAGSKMNSSRRIQSDTGCWMPRSTRVTN